VVLVPSIRSRVGAAAQREPLRRPNNDFLPSSSYVLPLHSAFIDVVGQCLLVTAFQAALWMGGDVETAPIEG
jgi:hypothetical protein